MDLKGKEGSFKGFFIIMIVSLAIALFWNSIPIIKNSVSAILNPTAGALLNWSLNWGMTVLVLVIAIFTTILQKYGTDQKMLKELKAEQKRLSAEAKELRHDPEKAMKKQGEITKISISMMKLSFRPIIYTAIPLFLFFRWFMDYFTAVGNPAIFGFFNWFWFYLLFSVIFSSILRKVFNVA